MPKVSARAVSTCSSRAKPRSMSSSWTGLLGAAAWTSAAGVRGRKRGTWIDGNSCAGGLASLLRSAPLVGGPQGVHGVPHPDVVAELTEVTPNLEDAADVAGEDCFGAGVQDVTGLAL